MTDTLPYGPKTFDDYGRHAVTDRHLPHPFDVFRYIGFGRGVHPSRLADDYAPRHALYDAGGDVAYPVVFLDAYRGWVRELPFFDRGEWFASEVI